MQTRSILLLPGLLALCTALPLLAGCDDARQRLAEAIRPASAVEVAGALRDRIAKGEFAHASRDGVAWLAKQTDPSGAVAWETAKASAQAGKADDAVRFAALAIKGGAVAPMQLMSEPLLAPVRVDTRMVVLAAGVSPDAAVAPARADAVSVAIDGGGIKASAGDVSVQLPD